MRFAQLSNLALLIAAIALATRLPLHATTGKRLSARGNLQQDSTISQHRSLDEEDLTVTPYSSSGSNTKQNCCRCWNTCWAPPTGSYVAYSKVSSICCLTDHSENALSEKQHAAYYGEGGPLGGSRGGDAKRNNCCIR